MRPSHTYRAALLLFLFSLAGSVAGLELDRAELEETTEADIEFQNYEGPVDQIDTAAAIRGIGSQLGSAMGTGPAASYFGRYTVRRVIGDTMEPGRAADIIELSADARVDHIRNLRRIVSGYLETAWGYASDDAELLARFITIYNAVHRGNISFFQERYRTAVVEALDSGRVGLAISYSEWAGNTQLVIPIRDDRAAGDLDAVDPGQLVDGAVIAQLRTRTDLGINDRKAIIDFIERVIEERQEAVDQAREEIAAEREQIQQEREDIAEEAPPEPAQPEQPAAPVNGGSDEGTAEPAEEPPSATEPPATQDAQPDAPAAQTEDGGEAAPAVEQQTPVAELDQREAELDAREAAVDEEQQQIDELTDQVEELYQETAQDQAAATVPTRRLPFVIAQSDGSLELSVIERSGGDSVGEQTIPVFDRTFREYQGRLLAQHRTSRRLLMLDSQSLEIIEESTERLPERAAIVLVDQRILTVVEENGEAFIGEYDAQLVLVQRSRDAVRPQTDIVTDDETGEILVQAGADGSVQALTLEPAN